MHRSTGMAPARAPLGLSVPGDIQARFSDEFHDLFLLSDQQGLARFGGLFRVAPE
ncbi:hypothetical protein QTI17_33570 [Variovorax sp. J31P179]|uniref:hypothetical protein n=1 Tax=Variovorax sp. J31P179 TaxID=3053508 RepID=UPI0025762809|nr:hypothetical protein [Variovorax sp. J31P179]MDM0085532.1 hypothetical protein [Variovorax sp. J31P179]